ncbi:SNF2-related protein [uncultured Tolumonas sp.]|uniref:SNF2-related protein n=1 Tax=uncultured Tolumonas sp. TaxID=263765 RepID=UPI002A0A8371|nr:SNF2-related protein [uncultured Tolumonas sp.]
MKILFDDATSASAKGMLAKLRLVSSLARVRKELISLPGGPASMMLRLTLVKRANQIRIELRASEIAAQVMSPLQINDTPSEPIIGARANTAKHYQFHETRTKGQRKKANDAAVSLLNQVKLGQLSRNQLSEEDLAVLAGYSGNGGSLVGADGKKGSAYEYYTPKPIAEGVWVALAEMGFSGGKVLDPCSGTGIFSATAPKNSVIDAVELDETSGSINSLINDGDCYSTTISPFEAVAASTPDEVFDAVVTNVPFGSVADRGGNQLLDGKYQKETLESYFILRSLDKLKPGGLAAFVVPPRCTSGRGAAEVKLRQRASLKADFIGAYRLPNSVFGAADADTITDVIFFRKYSHDAAEKIAELKEQSPETLSDALVLWDTFIDGRYFSEDGKRFVLGEFVPKDPDKFRDVDRVKNPASIQDVAKLLRKLPDSRVNWELLDAKETGIILYGEGDTITKDGQTLQMQSGSWVVMAKNDNDRSAMQLLAKCKDAYTAFYSDVPYEEAKSLVDYMRGTSQSMDIPAWLSSAMAELNKLKANEDRLKAWRAGIVGLAMIQVLDESGRSSGTNFLSEYGSLSDAIKKVSPSAKRLPGGIGSEFKRGLGEMASHYDRKRGFSAVWRGDVQASPTVDISVTGGFEGLIYQEKSNWIATPKAKEVLGVEFDPIGSDEWCISADGSMVSRADDYYVGSYGAYLLTIDSQIASATNGQIKQKLMRQRMVASQRVDKVDVSKISFNLFSPYVTIEQKAEFLRRFVHPGAVVAFDEKTSDPQIEFDIPGSKLTDREKLIKRVGVYLKNGAITLGGAKLSTTDEAAIKELRNIINQANEQFNGWARGNKTVTDLLEAKTSDPARLRFTQTEDESPLPIPGMNPALTLHGYQNSYVRQKGRDFSGINGFDVGLGKTFTALACVQYVQSIGVKKKTLFVVPNSVLSNWLNECKKAYQSIDDCLFVGLREDGNGGYSVSSSNYDEDLARSMENRHAKIFVTMEAFERIRLKGDTISSYESFMRSVDASFAESEDKKADERKKGKARTLLSVLGDKTGSAPYLEDMGIDSIVIDEGHCFKNSAETVDFSGGKYLSLSQSSRRGVDAQAKSWYVRGKSALSDGVLLLTATPITNSPLEIYAMMSLASGHDRVNDMFAGTSGSDGFMNAICQIENEDDETIDGELRSINVFKGLNNVEMLRSSLRSVATIKSAKDVGGQIRIPESPEVSSPVALPSDTRQQLEDYKQAYRFAADTVAGRSQIRGDAEAYERVMTKFGEPMQLIAHPFNLINKMTMLIADPDLDNRVSRYRVSDMGKYSELVSLWNEKKYSEERTRPGPNCTESQAISKRTRHDASGEVIGYTYKMPVKAWIEGEFITIDSVSPDIQDKFEALAEKTGLDLDVDVPPKLAAMLENFQTEAATPRGVDDKGNKISYAKQIIFCDLISSHNKIKRLLAKRAGVPSSSIAIITGQRNSAPDEIQGIQDGFNAFGEDNKYRVIIANEKGEVGLNLQKGTQAIHHLTIGWTPDSLTQRNGRSVRQGNKTGSVTVYHYDADGTFDSAKRSLVNSKADWIGSLMSNDVGSTLAITGGMSREQMEALIDAIGDSDAISKLQESMANKEASRRAASNRERQLINLNTIERQNAFLSENDSSVAWIASKFGPLMAVMGQVQQLRSRLANPKISETARVRNEAVLSELEAKLRGIESQINEAATIKLANGDAIDPQSVVRSFIEKAKRGENRATDLIKSLRSNRLGWSNIVIDVNEGSELVIEWQSETGMAESMRKQAVDNYQKQSVVGGAMPEPIAAAFASGDGAMIGEVAIMKGCFINGRNDLYVVSGTSTARCLSGFVEKEAVLSRIVPLQSEVVYPGTAEYEVALTQAAAAEDACERNGQATKWYSEVCPDVATRRETEVMVSYHAHSHELPSPYFPVAIIPSSVSDDTPVLSRILTEQSSAIARWEGNKFVVSSHLDVAPGKQDRYQAIKDYTVAHKMKATLADFGGLKFYAEKLIQADMPSGVLFSAALIGNSADEINNSVVDLIQKSVPWFDFGGAEVSYIDFGKRREMNLAIEKSTPKTEELDIETEVMVSKSIESNAIVYVGGETYQWKDRIKDYGKKYGDYAKWDGDNKAWKIQHQAWVQLITDFPKLAESLHLKDA